MEQTISRADLLEPEASVPSSPDSSQIKQIQEFNFIHHEELPDAKPDDGEDGFTFQLFAPTTGSSNIARIRLDSPDLADTEPGLLQPDRDSAYYFTGPPGLEQQQNFEAAAISGEYIMALSKTVSPGMAYSWKVLHVPATKKQRLLLKPSDDLYAKLAKESAPVVKRAKPNKKARIAGRVKLAAERTSREAEQKAAEAKEILEKEKRVRRNREKKLKKRGKAKAKKAEAVSGSTGVAAEVDEAESEDGD